MSRKVKKSTDEEMAKDRRTKKPCQDLEKRAAVGQLKKPWKFLEYLKKSGGLVSFAIQNYLRDDNTRKMCYSEHDNWLKRVEGYSSACDAIREGTIDMAEAVIFGELKNNNLTAATYYLNNLGKRRGYNADKLKIEHSGTIQHNVTVDFGDRE